MEVHPELTGASSGSRSVRPGGQCPAAQPSSAAPARPRQALLRGRVALQGEGVGERRAAAPSVRTAALCGLRSQGRLGHLFETRLGCLSTEPAGMTQL